MNYSQDFFCFILDRVGEGNIGKLEEIPPKCGNPWLSSGSPELLSLLKGIPSIVDLGTTQNLSFFFSLSLSMITVNMSNRDGESP